jgi:membrane protease subunit (stomatin/prohibitin family)
MTIDVIEVLDDSGDEMVRRIPSSGSGEFKLGAQVIVRESQVGVFFRDGKCYDAFGPGRHTLSTLNLPLLSERITDRVFRESPFRAEVYFVNQKAFLNVKWGTRDPIAYRDKELALVRLRAHGQMAVRVGDPVLFVNKVVGTQGVVTTKGVVGFLKSLVVSSLAEAIAAHLGSVFDLPSQYTQLSTAARVRVLEQFASYGAELLDLVIESITPPDEVQTRIDERSGMAAIGDLNRYLRYKSAIAIEDAASNPSGAGGDVGAAAGLGLGLAVMRQAQTATDVLGAIGSPSHGASPVCDSCGHVVPAGSKFCSECGTSLVAALCMTCKQPLAGIEKFCANCGSPTGRA